MPCMARVELIFHLDTPPRDGLQRYRIHDRRHSPPELASVECDSVDVGGASLPSNRGETEYAASDVELRERSHANASSRVVRAATPGRARRPTRRRWDRHQRKAGNPPRAEELDSGEPLADHGDALSRRALCAPRKIRTSDTWFRRPVLYPAELWAHFPVRGATDHTRALEHVNGLSTALSARAMRPIANIAYLPPHPDSYAVLPVV